MVCPHCGRTVDDRSYVSGKAPDFCPICHKALLSGSDEIDAFMNNPKAKHSIGRIVFATLCVLVCLSAFVIPWNGLRDEWATFKAANPAMAERVPSRESEQMWVDTEACAEAFGSILDYNDRVLMDMERGDNPEQNRDILTDMAALYQSLDLENYLNIWLKASNYKDQEIQKVREMFTAYMDSFRQLYDTPLDQDMATVAREENRALAEALDLSVENF